MFKERHAHKNKIFFTSRILLLSSVRVFYTEAHRQTRLVEQNMLKTKMKTTLKQITGVVSGKPYRQTCHT